MQVLQLWERERERERALNSETTGIEWKIVNGFNGNGRGDDDGGDWNHLIQSNEGEDNKPQICTYGFQ